LRQRRGSQSRLAPFDMLFLLVCVTLSRVARATQPRSVTPDLRGRQLDWREGLTSLFGLRRGRVKVPRARRDGAFRSAKRIAARRTDWSGPVALLQRISCSAGDEGPETAHPLTSPAESGLGAGGGSNRSPALMARCVSRQSAGQILLGHGRRNLLDFA